MTNLSARAPVFFIAQIQSGGVVQSVFYLLMVVIALALIWRFGRWVGGKLGANGIVITVWDGLFLLIGLVLAVNFLMGLAGHQFIRM